MDQVQRLPLDAIPGQGRRVVPGSGPRAAALRRGGRGVAPAPDGEGPGSGRGRGEGPGGVGLVRPVEVGVQRGAVASRRRDGRSCAPGVVTRRALKGSGCEFGKAVTAENSDFLCGLCCFYWREQNGGEPYEAISYQRTSSQCRTPHSLHQVMLT